MNSRRFHSENALKFKHHVNKYPGHFCLKKYRHDFSFLSDGLTLKTMRSKIVMRSAAWISGLMGVLILGAVIVKKIVESSANI